MFFLFTAEQPRVIYITEILYKLCVEQAVFVCDAFLFCMQIVFKGTMPGDFRLRFFSWRWHRWQIYCQYRWYWWQFATGGGDVDTGGKFIASIVDTGVNLPQVSKTPAVAVEKFATGVIDTGGAPSLANISENFRKNSKLPAFYFQWLGGRFMKKTEEKNFVNMKYFSPAKFCEIINSFINLWRTNEQRHWIFL
jgi:hypothetical protein